MSVDSRLDSVPGWVGLHTLLLGPFLEGFGVDGCDRAGVLERTDAFDTLLATDAGLLHAAERSTQVEAGGAVVVDPDVSALERASHPLSSFGASRPHRPAQACPGVVGQADGVFFGVEGDDRDDGAELLHGDNAQVRVGVYHDRRAHEVAARELPTGQLAELAHVGAGILGLLDEFLHERFLRRRVERAHRGPLIEAVPDDCLAQAVGQTVHDLVEARAVHVDALGVHADLAGGVVDRGVQAVKVGVVDDGVFEEDRRVVAAQFQGDPSERLRGHLHHPLAAVHRSGEANLCDVGVLNQARHVLVLAGDDVQHPGRELLCYALHELGGGKRRGRRRLDDRRVPGQQRVRKGCAQDRDRPVERDDDRGHTQRLVRHLRVDGDRAGHRGEGVVGVDLVGEHESKVPADLEHECVDPRLEADLAVLLRQDRRVLVTVIRDPGDRLGHQACALFRAQSRPRRKSLFRGSNRVGDVLRRSGRGLADNRARLSWVRDLQRLVGEPFGSPDEQTGPYTSLRQRVRHPAPLCVLSS